jgi:hypothetical protein
MTMTISLMKCITTQVFWKLGNNIVSAGSASKEISSAGKTNNPPFTFSLRTEESAHCIL